jgi:hypothetical protein
MNRRGKEFVCQEHNKKNGKRLGKRIIKQTMDVYCLPK